MQLSRLNQAFGISSKPASFQQARYGHTESNTSKAGFATEAIHRTPDPLTGAVIPPIYSTSTFAFKRLGQDQPYDYSRSGNPNRADFEASVARMEKAKYGIASASGLGALSLITTALLRPGDHVLAHDDAYGGSYRLMEHILKPWGVDVEYVSFLKPQDLAAKIKPQTKALFYETPGNPTMQVVDIQAISRVAKRHNLTSVVDNTFASPYLQNPLVLGADVVWHSATKYLNGHSDATAGIVLTNRPELAKAIRFIQNATGNVPSPETSAQVVRGTKTLPLRMQRHGQNAKAVALFLQNHPAVARVVYPGLATHPQHQMALQQMSGSGGGMVTFDLKGGLEAAKAFTAKLKYFPLAVSLGGVESLSCHPYTMTHASMPEPIKLARGIKPGTMRLSVGLEDKTDLIQDLRQALKDLPS